jgi:hypothetical protein
MAFTGHQIITPCSKIRRSITADEIKILTQVPHGNSLEAQVTTPHVTPHRKFTKSTYCPHIVLVRLVWFSAQTAITPLHNIQ